MPRRRVRLYRTLLQSETPALDDRIFEPYGVREADWISLSGCQPNRVQLIETYFLVDYLCSNRHQVSEWKAASNEELMLKADYIQDLNAWKKKHFGGPDVW